VSINVIKASIFLLMIALLCCLLCACGVEEYRFKLNADGNGYILEKYNYTSSDAKDEVVIPDTYEGLPVVEIENGAFAGHTTLKSVVIPEGVEIIGCYAFGGCSDLVDVTIPSSVIAIEDKAFERCSSLVEINIPQAVKIGRYAFTWCSSLDKVSFGMEAEDVFYTVGYGAFENCKSLKTAELGPCYELIDEYAFAYCEKLSEITLSSGLQKIGSQAFLHCAALDNIYFWGTKDEMAAIKAMPWWAKDAGKCDWTIKE
jgi:hypothetical protein